jgi:hypothetical protein
MLVKICSRSASDSCMNFSCSITHKRRAEDAVTVQSQRHERAGRVRRSAVLN